MLFLLFQLGQDRYVIEARCVVEVLPLLALKQIPQAPRGVAGLFNYRSRPVPAVDLSELTLGLPARQSLSTRIILVNYPDDAGKNRLLGLIAEQATEVIRKEPKDFVDTGLKQGAASYLGPVAMDHHGVVQWVREQRLLPEPVRNLLFSETAEPV
jgi:chemotaxis-related protein WspB